MSRTKKPTTPKKAPAARPGGKTAGARASKSAGSAKSKAKKSPTKKGATKKPAKKAATKKPTAKKAAAKKPAPGTKKSAPAKKTPARGAGSREAKSKKPLPAEHPPKSVPAKAGPTKPESPKAPAAETAETGGDKRGGRKGITIVSKKPQRKSKPKPKISFSPPGERLLGPGSPVRRPLIPSGPAATSHAALERHDPSKPRKSPLGKRDLGKYRDLLLMKRRQLLGDVEQIENDALRSESGDLSHFPQHMADQGSESFDRSLSLDLAAADRRLIKEIDDALKRIEDGIYGLCEMTGRPISAPRLTELPWARYSIEAAREIERRGGL
jgi:RNA polymerase-binding transcription factor DksA